MTKTVLEAFLAMKPRPHDDEAVRIMTDPETRARVIVQIESWPALALPSPDNAVMVCGAALSDDIAEVWMVAGVGFEKHLRTLLRQQRQLLKSAVEMFAPRKIKILVDPDRPGAAKYVQRLGFEFEKKRAVDMYFFNQEKGK